MAGPAFTVVAEDDHLPVMSALAEAAPGDVLVVAAFGGTRAVFGELFATEARRRGLAGIVSDGYCRDLRGLREIGLPVFARGTTPRSGTTVSRAAPGATVDLRRHRGRAGRDRVRRRRRAARRAARSGSRPRCETARG